MDKKTKDLQQAENLARHYETRYAEESNKYNTALADKKKAQDEARVCILVVWFRVLVFSFVYSLCVSGSKGQGKDVSDCR